MIDFSIFPASGGYEYKNVEDVLRVGNLSAVAFDYFVEPKEGFMASPGTYSNVMVVPKF